MGLLTKKYMGRVKLAEADATGRTLKAFPPEVLADFANNNRGFEYRDGTLYFNTLIEPVVERKMKEAGYG